MLNTVFTCTFTGLGMASVLVSALIGLYYNVIICIILVYMVSSMTKEIPWAQCGHDWNTIFCQSNTSLFDNDTIFHTPPEEFY